MSQPAGVLYRIWVYLKPQTSDILIYQTFEAALRACTVEDGEVTEWVAIEGVPRLRAARTWIRRLGTWIECSEEYIDNTG